MTKIIQSCGPKPSNDLNLLGGTIWVKPVDTMHKLISRSIECLLWYEYKDKIDCFNDSQIIDQLTLMMYINLIPLSTRMVSDMVPNADNKDSKWGENSKFYRYSSC